MVVDLTTFLFLFWEERNSGLGGVILHLPDMHFQLGQAPIEYILPAMDFQICVYLKY